MPWVARRRLPDETGLPEREDPWERVRNQVEFVAWTTGRSTAATSPNFGRGSGDRDWHGLSLRQGPGPPGDISVAELGPVSSRH